LPAHRPSAGSVTPSRPTQYSSTSILPCRAGRNSSSVHAAAHTSHRSSATIDAASGTTNSTLGSQPLLLVAAAFESLTVPDACVLLSLLLQPPSTASKVRRSRHSNSVDATSSSIAAGSASRLIALLCATLLQPPTLYSARSAAAGSRWHTASGTNAGASETASAAAAAKPAAPCAISAPSPMLKQLGSSCMSRQYIAGASTAENAAATVSAGAGDETICAPPGLSCCWSGMRWLVCCAAASHAATAATTPQSTPGNTLLTCCHMLSCMPACCPWLCFCRCCLICAFGACPSGPSRCCWACTGLPASQLCFVAAVIAAAAAVAVDCTCTVNRMISAARHEASAHMLQLPAGRRHTTNFVVG
jgi:hypothetical protein